MDREVVLALLEKSGFIDGKQYLTSLSKFADLVLATAAHQPAVGGVATTCVDRAPSVGSDGETPLVMMDLGIPEDAQEGSFMNATLQSAGEDLAFSVATRVDVPQEIVACGQKAVDVYLRNALEAAARATSGISFQVQLGPSRDACNKFQDGEVLGIDADGNLLCWNRDDGETYNCGETLAEYGADNLTEAERTRINLAAHTPKRSPSPGM